MQSPGITHVHVAFCGDVYGDYERLRQAERTGRTIEWPVPRVAMPGERVAFYNVDLEKCFVATGKIADRQSRRGRIREGCMMVGNIRMLGSPVPMDVIRSELPGWGWARFTRNVTTVREEMADSLWALLGGASRSRSASTASKADDMFGSKLYQARAREALPLLVKLAGSGQKIFYQGLADVMGMTNPRLLNYVLGSVGQTLLRLGRRWRSKIPALQLLVVNQSDNLPGEGVADFISQGRYDRMTKSERRAVVDKIHEEIWSYPRWPDVLEALDLDEVAPPKRKKLRQNSLQSGGGFGDSERNKLVEKAAIQHATRVLRSQNYKVTSREQEKLGFDLEAVRGAETLRIEVKGVNGRLPQFMITAGELNCAAKHASFRLFLVMDALSQKPRHHIYSGSELRTLFALTPTAYRASLK